MRRVIALRQRPEPARRAPASYEHRAHAVFREIRPGRANHAVGTEQLAATLDDSTREAHVAEERQVDVRRLRVQNRVRKPARGSSLAHAVPTPARARGSQLPRLVRAHARVSRVARLAIVHEKLAQLDAIRGLGVAPFGEPLGRAKRSKAGSGGIVLIR